MVGVKERWEMERENVGLKDVDLGLLWVWMFLGASVAANRQAHEGTRDDNEGER